MLSKPFGATDISIDCNRFGQSLPGKTPRAGRLIRAEGRNLNVKNSVVKVGSSQYFSSYVSIRILQEALDDYSQVALRIFECKYPREHCHQHRPNSFRRTYRNQQTVVLSRHSEK